MKSCGERIRVRQLQQRQDTEARGRWNPLCGQGRLHVFQEQRQVFRGVFSQEPQTAAVPADTPGDVRRSCSCVSKYPMPRRLRLN